MRKSRVSVALANLVMETVSDLQKSGEKATMKDIKSHILNKYGHKAEKFMTLIPQYVTKGVNLGIIGKFGDNYRTKMYIAKRRKKSGGKRRRRRRRRRH